MVNENKPIIFVLVGLPGSGKSTWIKNKVANSDRNYVTLSTDDLLEKYIEQFGITYNTAVRDHYEDAAKQMRSDFRDAIKNSKNIIWDQTNLTLKARRRILAQVPKIYHKVVVLFEVYEEELNRRLEERAFRTGKKIPAKVIEDMKSYYVRPLLTEGFDEMMLEIVNKDYV